ncbi:MAG TPA: ABC transporter permease [Puia sp.]|jgi:putative ABC transport system permease protein|nr:ABC transporter permease [Puia sp.]
MFRNNFKIAWRNLIKDRQFTFLNLIGLSTGLACAILIYLWVNDELHVDKFNEKDGQLYQVMLNESSSHGIETGDNTPGLLANALSKEIPEVEYAASVIPSTWFANKGLISFEDAHLRASGEYVSKDYLHIFTCNFLAGDKNKLTSNKYNIAISKELALKLFNTTDDVIGKNIEWNQEGVNGNYLVSGIFEKFPSNAIAQFDILFSYDLFLEKNPKLQRWDSNDPYTYLILKKGTDINQFNKKIAGFIKSKDEKSTVTLFAQRFSDKYLHGHYENGAQAGGRIEYVKLFSVIAIFILIIACINFTNLSTARASKRIKEIGIKKVMGASRGKLIVQYMNESMLITLLSLVITVVLLIFFLPRFNEITGKHLALNIHTNLVLAVLAITVITGFIAGSYPALYLSGFKPVSVLKGKLETSFGELMARKGLVIFQFTLSVMLIVSVIIVYQQIELVQTKNLGYNRDHIIYFEKGGKLSDNKEDYKQGGVYEQNLETFLQKVKGVPGVVKASNFRHSITNRHGGTTAVSWPGKAPGNQTAFTDIAAGYDFIETLGIAMKEGRTYSKDFGSEKSKVIFNEAAIDAMGLKNPIGKTVNIWGEDKEIIGVTKNFHFESLYENIRPCFFDLSLNQRVSKIMVKIKAGSERTTIANLSKFYKNYTGEPLEYKFLDEDYQALYLAEQRVAMLSRYFAGLAIIISCLGLFGLAAFTAQRRQKEIGIRKIVGATVGNVAFLLSKDFLKLVGIAILIAFPLSWWAMNAWLHAFAYRINIGMAVFLVAGASIILITLLTTSVQAINAAVANPVKSLRTE